MNAADEYWKSVKATYPDLPSTEVLSKVAFAHNGKEGWNDSDDLNGEFRELVVEEMFNDRNFTFPEMIRFLLREEFRFCRHVTTSTETLRQLTFMLFLLNEMHDIPLLFEAKFDTSFDAGIGLDIELIFGFDKERTKAHFRSNPHPEYNIVSKIEDYERYEARNAEQFIASLNSYYGR